MHVAARRFVFVPFSIVFVIVVARTFVCWCCFCLSCLFVIAPDLAIAFEIGFAVALVLAVGCVLVFVFAFVNAIPPVRICRCLCFRLCVVSLSSHPFAPSF